MCTYDLHLNCLSFSFFPKYYITGDITRKGYEKKKNRLLTPFFPLPSPPDEPPPPERPSHGANRIFNARTTNVTAIAIAGSNRKSSSGVNESDQDATHGDDDDEDLSSDFAPIFKAAAAIANSSLPPPPPLVHGTVSPTTRAKRRQRRRLRSRCHYGK